MIFAPVTTTPDHLHTIRGTQAAWGKALELATHVNAGPVEVLVAQRIAADAECELRDLWNAA